MAKKTNKTSHVLNLITNGNPQPEPEQQAVVPQTPASAETQQTIQPEGNTGAASLSQGQSGTLVQGGQPVVQTAPVPVSVPQTMPAAGQMLAAGTVSAPVSEKKVIVVDDSDTNRLSDAIRDQLITHLEEEEKAKAQSVSQAAQEIDPAVVKELIQPEENAGAASLSQEESGTLVQGGQAVVETAPAPVSVPQTVFAAEPQISQITSAEPPAQVQAENTQQGIQPESVSTSQGQAAVAPVPASVQSTPSGQEMPQSAVQANQPFVAESQLQSAPVAVQPPKQEPEPTYRMVNVMEQILKRQKLEQQMERYGVCTCSRCRADVEALALTKLPAKYIVVDKSTVAPMIGFYENRYRVNILTQIIRACIQVKEEPHHENR